MLYYVLQYLLKSIQHHFFLVTWDGFCLIYRHIKLLDSKIPSQPVLHARWRCISILWQWEPFCVATTAGLRCAELVKLADLWQSNNDWEKVTRSFTAINRFERPDSGEIVGRECLKYSGLMNLKYSKRYLSKRLTRNRVLNSKTFQLGHLDRLELYEVISNGFN